MDSRKRGQGIGAAAASAGMSENSARRYRKLGVLPSTIRPAHTWRTRIDPLEAVWPTVQELLEAHPGLQGTTIFEELRRRFPGQLSDGQLRTLQRRIKHWGATQGPGKAVMFPQTHYPGQIGASDFCHLSGLNVTIGRQPFPHLLYHFVLTYSNWETGRICFSESFESLCEGLQSALAALGGIPERHRTDCLSAAVYRLGGEQGFTPAYEGLLAHYGLAGEHIQAGQANENGDVEQRHHRFRTSLDQALMLRGSRDFETRLEYAGFIETQFCLLNATRQPRFLEELACLRELPAMALDASTAFDVRVGPSSTIRVKNNVYSVPSRLIGETVQVRLRSEEVEVWFAQCLQLRIPRLRGHGGHFINYRHVIDSLVRKAGAFDHYRWRSDLFPTSAFRMAFDSLSAASTTQRRADKEYLAILQLAAKGSESVVRDALRLLLLSEEAFNAAGVQALVESGTNLRGHTEVTIEPVSVGAYDELLRCAASLAAPPSPSHVTPSQVTPSAAVTS